MMYLGTAPDNTNADIADIWEFLGRMRNSPGEQVAIIAACMPEVVPPTRNHVCEDPKSLAASTCASNMGP
ncbi:hypothetical protein PHAVU_011G051200 [Phaseolus vulgaris]|uniref:Uncharacterized protein n=1 Tax=Phaseolus vulgaris TaxID=3885 RepID=V7AGC9_PHAVU|nr:hypothetical protein PHAVU_011G051200g [Phaseolus vulgaris]ESW03908.1 hypothetical protein PHAVU_011G051200g [Phaseolus vulgaris]